jgi:hypothetical protein
MPINGDSAILGSAAPRTDRYRLAGITKVDGIPASRYVSVYDRRDFSWVASILSDPITGHWQIFGLPQYPEKVLCVIEFDTTETYNPKAADYITQAAAT